MLTEKTVIGKIEILEDGQIQVRRDRVVFDDETEISRLYHREVLPPGTSLASITDTRLHTVCRAVWTDDVKTAFATAQLDTALPQGVLAIAP